ncbi:MAG TPA: amino acid adenylation domain-containing protein, partial [Longimicrobium sp.]|nr:amino acid adenylation domain-containing protein [Longimicrobium sp.]
LGVSRADHEAFFRDLLADVDEPTVPFGLLDVQGDGSQIVQASLRVEAALAARLRARARVLRVSAASLCHVAWAQVLARVSRRGDVVFGTVLFGRMQGDVGTGRVMGPFINTLPVRVRVGTEGVEATVRRTHALLSDLLRHEHASLALAQRCSRVQAPAPLFTSIMNYRHRMPVEASPAAETGDEPRGTVPIRGEERTNYPLTLSVDDLGEDGFRLTIKVKATLDPARVCALVQAALAGLVGALETAPGTPLARLDVLPAAERRRVLEEWNATAAAYPRDPCMHELVQAQAARTPDAVALVFEGRSLSYAELNGRANRLAHHLRKLGVGPDARVAICVERSLEMVVGLLAVLKAGGAYVPLDPAYPAERLRFMLADSAPAVVLTQARPGEAPLAALFEGLAVPVLFLDAAAPAWADEPDVDPARAGLAPGHLAYVIYTSGSTGRPKGVALEHRAMVNRLMWMQEVFGLGADDAMLQNTSFSFDASVWEFFLPLMTGARVVMVGSAGQRDPVDVVETIRRERITTVFFVSSMLQLCLEAPGVEGCTEVRHVLSGGEALAPVAVRRFHERLPGAVLHNIYGPSEAAVAVRHGTVARDAARVQVPIGRPVSNTRVYLLDGRGEPVPVGVAGEIHVGGMQVARGYLGRPELTAERFGPDPFCGEPGARLYRTGDLGRWGEDGALEFLGRDDFQVKVRGHRVELGEIEAWLAEHAAVREAVVVAREDVAGDQRLVAYVVGAREGEEVEVEVEALRAHLAERLPAYMVPAAYVRLDALPLTPSGKVDRRALPAPEGDAYARRAYAEPVGEVEQALAEIWAEVLGVERVGRHDNFFELGGHSLLVVRLVGRMQGEGLHAEVRALFTAPTLAELADATEPFQEIRL